MEIKVPSPPASQINQPSLGELGFEFLRYFNLFLRNLWLVVSIVVIVMIGAFAYLLRSPKLYESQAVLQVEGAEEKVLSVDELQSEKMDALDYLKTLQEAMTNNSVLYRVVIAAGLDKDPTFAKPGKVYSPNDLAARLDKRVTVKLERGTRIMTLTADDPSPERARDIVNLMLTEFLRQNFEQRFSLSNIANQFLLEEADKLKKKLEDSEQKLQAYKEANKAVSLEDSQNIIVDKLKELNTKETDAKSALLKLESDIEQLRKLPPDDYDDILQIGSVAAIPEISNVRDQIFRSEADLSAVQKRYLPKHPKYIEAQTQLDQLKRSLRESLKNAGNILQKQYQSAQDTEAKMQAALADQEKTALDLNKIAIPYNVLSREVDSDRTMYDAVITRQRETTITEGIEKSPFRVIEEPMVSSIPAKPRWLLTLAAAFVLGCGLAGGVVIGRDILDPSLRTVDEAERYLDLPCLTVVPDIRRRKNQEALAGRSLVLIEEPQSIQAEAFRTLRAALSLLGQEGNRKLFLITSAVPAEGKSFTAINIALAFALEGKKTLLIDADLRRPSINRVIFNESAKASELGLTDLLSGNAKLEEVILRSDKLENLFVLSAGHRAPNPAELLGSPALAEFISKFDENYDRVVIDSAPVNAVSDTLFIAPLVDQAIIIVRSGKTSKKPITRACLLLRKVGGKIAGFVLNRSQISRAAGYDYYYYGGDYTKGEVYGSRNG